MQLQGCLVQIKLLQIVNREGSNFVIFLNRTAVLMDQSESVAQPTPGTSSGTDSATIPPVLKASIGTDKITLCPTGHLHWGGAYIRNFTVYRRTGFKCVVK